jgi:hypothetical protein
MQMATTPAKRRPAMRAGMIRGRRMRKIRVEMVPISPQRIRRREPSVMPKSPRTIMERRGSKIIVLA